MENKDEPYSRYMSINNYKMSPHQCPVCYGHGTLPAHFYAENRGTSLAGEVPCKSCGGLGIIWG